MKLQRTLIQLGNILRGGYELGRVREAALLPALYSVNIKVPPFYDISHWENVTDWAGLNPRPLLIGTKATEADNYRDPTFPEYFTAMKANGYRRLAYHFFRRSVDPVRQANWFLDYVSPYLQADDILCLDFEEGGETAGQLWAFWNRVIQRKPSNQKIDYSRKGLMDPIAMSAAEKEFFKGIPSWVAGYPNDPNAFTSTPPAYIPDPGKWGPVWAWQYSDAGQVAGISDAVDLNLMEPLLIEFCDGVVNNDVVTHPFNGAEQVRGTRFGYQFSLLKLDLRGKRVSLYHDGSFVNVLDIAQRTGAVFAANASPWYESAPYDVRGLLVMDGQKIVNMDATAEPYLNVTRENVPQVKYGTANDWWNTYTGFRLLDRLSASNPAHSTQRAPRHLIGVDAQGRLLEMAIEGYEDAGGGVTLIEGWQMMQEFGAVIAMDGDGGYSVNQIVNGVQTLNVRGDDVKVVFLVSDGGSMDHYYELTPSAANEYRSVRADHPQAHILGTKVGQIGPNNIGKGTIAGKHVYEADVVVDGILRAKKGDTWHEVFEANGAGIIGWCAEIHLGYRYLTVREVGAPVEPPVSTVEDMPYTITFGGVDSPYVETTITGVVKAK